MYKIAEKTVGAIWRVVFNPRSTWIFLLNINAICIPCAYALFGSIRTRAGEKEVERFDAIDLQDYSLITIILSYNNCTDLIYNCMLHKLNNFQTWSPLKPKV
jgi:hypothetical protein